MADQPRVMCVYVDNMLRVETQWAIREFVPQRAEFRYVRVPQAPQVHSTYYADVLTHEWSQGKGIILIEQDIVIRARMIRELWRCRMPWCGYSYSVGGEPNTRMLGCTKFSSALMQSEPDLMATASVIQFNTGCMPGCWHRLDGAVLQTLEARGYSFHSHEPPVEHLHDYSSV